MKPKLFRWAFLGSLVATATSFLVSFSFAKSSGFRGVYPLSLLRALQAQFSPTFSVDEEESAVTNGITAIELKTRSAKIEVSCEDLPEAVVQTFGEAPTEAVLGTQPERFLILHQADGQLEITLRDGQHVREKHWPWEVASGARQLVLKVRLPNSYNGPVSIRSVSGIVVVKGCHFAQLDVNSTSGDFEVDQGMFNVLDFQGVNSDAHIHGTIGDLRAATTSGDIETQLVDLDTFARPHVDLRSISGDIDLNVARNSSLIVHLHSDSGTIQQNSLSLETSVLGGASEVTGKWGSGEGDLNAFTVSGDITLTGVGDDSE